jgi:ribosomal protein L24E
MEKCPVCGKEVLNNTCYAKVDSQIVPLCSIKCSYAFMVKSFNEGRGIGIRIPVEE